MAAVLLRRLLSNLEEFTTSIPDEVQQLCKVQLLQGVQVEQNANMRKKFCDAIAELAKCYISKFVHVFSLDLSLSLLCWESY